MKWLAVISIGLLATNFATGLTFYNKGWNAYEKALSLRQAKAAVSAVIESQIHEDEINKEYLGGVPSCDTAGLARTLDRLRGE